MSDQELVFQVVEGAKFSLQNDRYPSFAIIANEYGEIVFQSANLTSSELDPTAHAEIVAIREAAKKSRTLDLSNLTLYTAIEPCLMCLSAVYWSKIKRIVFILGRDLMDKKDFEGNLNNKEIITRFNKYISLEQNFEYEDKMKMMLDIWEDRQKKYWNHV